MNADLLQQIATCYALAHQSDNGKAAEYVAEARELETKLLAGDDTPGEDKDGGACPTFKTAFGEEVPALVLHRAKEAFEPLPPIDWVVEGLLSSCSTSVFAGDGGTGKSYTMLDLAVAVAGGEPQWLGHNVVQGAVLIVDEESGDHRMRNRLARALRGHDAPPDIPLYWVSMGGVDLRNDTDVERLAQAIEQSEARLIILDSMMDFTPGADENSVKDLQPAYHAMRVLADTHTCHLAGIHHFNKTGSYRGSTVIKGMVDLLVNVTRTGDTLSFKHEKVRDVDGVDFAAVANWNDGPPPAFNLSPGETREEKHGRLANDAGRTLARIAREEPGISQRSLAGRVCKELGCGKDLATNYINQSVGTWITVDNSAPRGGGFRYYAL
jgi:hypothetical protein